MKRRDFIQNTTLLSAGMAISPSLLGSNKREEDFESDRFAIVHTNDLHSNFDVFSNDHKMFPLQGGLENRIVEINTIRERIKNVLLVDAGDFLKGTSYFDEFQGELDIRSMNNLKYSAVTLGNHEFSLGLDTLAALLKKATFPILNANYVVEHDELRGLIQPNVIFKLESKKIGIFGIGIDLKGLVDDEIVEKIIYLDPIEVSQNQIDRLRSEGCDYVVCLSHLGYEYDQLKVSDKVLAKETNGLDAIIGGHTHVFVSSEVDVLNALGKNVRITQAGYGGLSLGQMEFFNSKIRSQLIDIR